MPAFDVLTYTWQGGRDQQSTANARTAIEAELTKRNFKIKGYRLFGYNSPFTSRSKQTQELQAILK
jgi:hypothetical protein